jgi:lantibiotic modifying enzyme
VLGDNELIAAAAECGRQVAEEPYTVPAFFNGTAGRLRCHLMLWDNTGAHEHLVSAVEAGEALLEAAEPSGDGSLCWAIPEGYERHSGRRYTGYGVGAAGIGDALLDLVEACGDERFLAASQSTARWLKSLAQPALDDESGLDWPIVEGEELQGARWGHGAAGIGLFFLHTAQTGTVPGAERYARRAARAAAYGARWSGPTLGYGLTGNIEFLLDMYQAYKEETYLREALELARLLEAFSVQQQGTLLWPSERPTVFIPSYLAGYCGVAACLLRLSDPANLPHLLSRRGFLRKSQNSPPAGNP